MADVQKLNLQSIEQNLDQVSQLLVPCLPLANAHATDFITKNYWETLLPSRIREELMSLSQEQLQNLPCTVSTPVKRTCTQDRQGSDLAKEQEDSADHIQDSADNRDLNNHEQYEIDFHEKNDTSRDSRDSSLNRCEPANEQTKESKLPFLCIDDFVSKARSCTIEGMDAAISPNDLMCNMGADSDEVFVSTYMNQKKSHEVEVMSKICAALAERLDCKLVVDFGSGKGYLGNHLSLQYQLPVLGIDAASTNTQSAEKRNTVLDKQWHSLARNKLLESEGRKLTKKEKKRLKQKQVPGFQAGDVETDFKEASEVPDVTEINKVENDTKIEHLKAECVLKTEFEKTSEINAALDHVDVSSIKLAKTVSNEKKFIPCTTFIDKETNFINLAKLHFPGLFPENQYLNEHEQSLSIKCHKETCDSTEMNNARKDFVVMNNSCRNISSTIEKSHVSHTGICTDHVTVCTCSSKATDNVNKCSSKATDNVNKCSSKATDNVNKCSSKATDNVNKCSSKATDNVNKCSSKPTDNVNTCSSKPTDNVENSFTAESSTESCCKSSNEDTLYADVSKQFNMMLIGLHTCGDLASTSGEVFVHSDQLKVLCNVGCCYHLINETFLDMTQNNGPATSQNGFPLSRFLNQRQFKLGNTARNLASQAVHRISDFEKLQGERFYPRALLEVLIHDVCGGNVEMKGLRKLEQKCKSTQEYLRRACDKLAISDKVTDETIERYMRKYTDDQHRLAAFFQLKAVLAPCIEALIILDRVCFLLEQDGVKDVFLVKMFDPVKSPRCYGIVAIKKTAA